MIGINCITEKGQELTEKCQKNQKTMVPYRLVERVLLRRAIGLELWRGRWRHMQKWGRSTEAHRIPFAIGCA